MALSRCGGSGGSAGARPRLRMLLPPLGGSQRAGQPAGVGDPNGLRVHPLASCDRRRSRACGKNAQAAILRPFLSPWRCALWSTAATAGWKRARASGYGDRLGWPGALTGVLLCATLLRRTRAGRARWIAWWALGCGSALVLCLTLRAARTPVLRFLLPARGGRDPGVRVDLRPRGRFHARALAVAALVVNRRLAPPVAPGGRRARVPARATAAGSRAANGTVPELRALRPPGRRARPGARGRGWASLRRTTSRGDLLRSRLPQPAGPAVLRAAARPRRADALDLDALWVTTSTEACTVVLFAEGVRAATGAAPAQPSRERVDTYDEDSPSAAIPESIEHVDLKPTVARKLAEPGSGWGVAFRNVRGALVVKGTRPSGRHAGALRPALTRQARRTGDPGRAQAALQRVEGLAPPARLHRGRRVAARHRADGLVASGSAGQGRARGPPAPASPPRTRPKGPRIHGSAAQPIEQVRVSCRPSPRSNGVPPTASRRRPASCSGPRRARSRARRSVRTLAPPHRTTRSESRSTPERRAASVTRKRSPTGWPCRSLTSS